MFFSVFTSDSVLPIIQLAIWILLLKNQHAFGYTTVFDSTSPSDTTSDGSTGILNPTSDDSISALWRLPQTTQSTIDTTTDEFIITLAHTTDEVTSTITSVGSTSSSSETFITTPMTITSLTSSTPPSNSPHRQVCNETYTCIYMIIESYYSICFILK